MPRHSLLQPDEISIITTNHSGTWLTTAADTTPTTISSCPCPSDQPNTLSITENTAKTTAKPAKTPKRDPLQDYFHEQSKLFSSLQKRFDAFQDRAAEERGKKAPAKKPKAKILKQLSEQGKEKL
jgi:hypothetical protein